MKALRWLGILGGVVLLLVLASLGFRSVQERGIAGKLAKLRERGYPTTMAELNAWYVAVPAESNAALGVLAAVEMFPSDAPDKLPIIGEKSTRVELFEPWSEEARSLAADYVSSNSTAYAALHQSLKLPASRYPGTFSFNMLLPHLSPVKGAAQKLALAAQLAAEQGKPDEATAAIEDVFHVGRTLEPEPLFISALVRNAGVAIGASSAERVINRVELTDEQVARIQSVIASALATNSLVRGLVGEMAFLLDGVFLASMSPPSGAIVQPSPGEKFGYAIYTASGLKGADESAYVDAMIRLQEAASEDFPRRLTTVSNIVYEVSGGTNGWPFVKMITRMTIPSVARGIEREARMIAALLCAQAALAVERFRMAHGGTLPASLAELVPQYLAAVPSDPYDGKPLRFKPLVKGFVVYSLGEDGDDDGGRPFKRGQKTSGDYDVTFRIER